MAYPELYLNLNYDQKVIFAITIIMIVFIISIITKIKNKTRNIKKQQVNHNKTKNTLKIDYDTLINIYFKKQEFLGENNVRKAELIKMFS